MILGGLRSQAWELFPGPKSVGQAWGTSLPAAAATSRWRGRAGPRRNGTDRGGRRGHLSDQHASLREWRPGVEDPAAAAQGSTGTANPTPLGWFHWEAPGPGASNPPLHTSI